MGAQRCHYASAHLLRPDPARVVLRPFIPADDPYPHPGIPSRARPLTERVMALDDQAVEAELSRLMASLSDRHRNMLLRISELVRDGDVPDVIYSYGQLCCGGSE